MNQKTMNRKIVDKKNNNNQSNRRYGIQVYT